MRVASQSVEPAAANRRWFLSEHGKITLSANAIELLTDEDRFSFITSANAETDNNDAASECRRWRRSGGSRDFPARHHQPMKAIRWRKWRIADQAGFGPALCGRLANHLRARNGTVDRACAHSF